MKKRTLGAACIFIAFMLIFPVQVSIGNAKNKMRESIEGYMGISPEEANRIINKNSDVVILDVRSLEEYETCHIKKAVFLPLHEAYCSSCIHAKIGKYKDEKVIVYSNSGERSNIACNILMKKGFSEVYNLEGGIDAWINAGFPVASQKNNSSHKFLCAIMSETPSNLDEKKSPKPQIGNPPSQFSWRNYDGKDWTTSARYQGNCGSCWDFAAVGALESVINIEEGISFLNPDLSEQYVLSCLPMAGSCKGGSPYLAFKYMESSSADGNYHNGIIPESCFPYEANDDVPCSEKCNDWEEMLIPISNYGYWTPDGSSEDRQRIKTQLMEKGPLVTFMMATEDFMEWGIYNHNPNDYYPYPGRVEGINHCVVIVGWKDDSSIPRGGYWIVKNSWGSWWGYEGFFNIEYGSLHIDDYRIIWVEYDKDSIDWPPVADSGGPYYGSVGQQIMFNGESCDPEGSIVSYSWNFGDGSTSNEKNPTHAYDERGMYTVTLTVTDGARKQSTDKSSAFIDLWKEGESWTFDIKEIGINIEDVWGSAFFQGTLDELCMEVKEDDEEYILNLEGSIGGEFTVTLTHPQLNVSGRLIFTKVDGSIHCRADFGIEKVDVCVRGIIWALVDPIPIRIPIPFKVIATITFDPTYTPIHFPLEEGKEWDISPSNVSIDASVSLLFGIIKKQFQYELALGAVTTKCTGKENVTVEAGTYEAYKVSSMDILEFYYAEEVSNIIKLSAEFEDIFNIYGELISTDYGQ